MSSAMCQPRILPPRQESLRFSIPQLLHNISHGYQPRLQLINISLQKEVISNFVEKPSARVSKSFNCHTKDVSNQNRRLRKYKHVLSQVLMSSVVVSQLSCVDSLQHDKGRLGCPGSGVQSEDWTTGDMSFHTLRGSFSL